MQGRGECCLAWCKRLRIASDESMPLRTQLTAVIGDNLLDGIGLLEGRRVDATHADRLARGQKPGRQGVQPARRLTGLEPTTPRSRVRQGGEKRSFAWPRQRHVADTQFASRGRFCSSSLRHFPRLEQLACRRVSLPTSVPRDA